MVRWCDGSATEVVTGLLWRVCGCGMGDCCCGDGGDGGGDCGSKVVGCVVPVAAFALSTRCPALSAHVSSWKLPVC